METKLNSEYFITNGGEKTLAKIIKGILPAKADCLDFLVGYFYFSGIEEIYKHISDKKINCFDQEIIPDKLKIIHYEIDLL